MRRVASVTVLVILLSLLPAVSATGKRGPAVRRVPAGLAVSFDESDRLNLSAKQMRDIEVRDFQPRLVYGPFRYEAPSSERGTVRVAPTTARRTFQSSGGPNYVRNEIVDPSVAPFVQHGRIFFEDFHGNFGACSGTAVTSDSELTVVTAAHCVQDPEDGSFITAISFVPGYRDGATPFGEWFGTNAFVPFEWFDALGAPDPRFDVAVFEVAPMNNMTLVDEIGGRGLIFNLDQERAYSAFGYPAQPNATGPTFDGELLYNCISDPGGAHLAYPEGPPFPNAMGCDMTQGSSGGGWVINHSGQELLNSVVSYGVEGLPEMQFGPYFGDVALDVYEFSSGTDLPTGPALSLDEHKTKTTLKLKGKLKAVGKVKATDGYDRCGEGAYVGIFKLKRNVFKQIDEVFANAKGKYSAKLKNKKGVYAAASAAGYIDSFNLCEGSSSKSVKHKG